MRLPLCVALAGLLIADVAVAGGFGLGVPYTWLGHLETADGPVDGTVSANFVIVDGRGVQLDQVLDTSLLVVDGDFVVDFAVPLSPIDPFFVVATINGSDLLPNLPIEVTWPSALSASSALNADVADEAERIGPHTALLSRDRLGSGSVAVPVATVTGFPAAFLDGDQGLAFTPGATIDFSAGTIGIKAASLPGTALAGAPVAADLADGSIGTSDLANAGVLAADLSGVPLAKVASKTLTARHLSSSPFQLFEVTEANCRSDFVGKVTESATCSFTGTTTCTTFVGNVQTTGHRPCAAENQPTACFLGSTSSCPNTLAGALVLQ